MTMNKKPIPAIYDYLNVKKAELNFAYNISEQREFGSLNNLTMKVPYYQYDSYGNLHLDDNNNPITNYNLNEIVNERIIKFNNDLYLIKKVSPIKTTNNKKYIEIVCQEKAIELSYKNIAYLDMSPPIFNIAKVNTAILNILTSKFYNFEGYVQSSTTNTITFNNKASAVDDYYNGKKIAIVDGLGQGYDYRIIDYDGATFTATLETNLISSLNTTSLGRIHYSKWTVGEIDSDFLNDGSSDIYTSYKFESKTITECLSEIAEKFKGYLSYTYSYDETYNEYVNKVNLIKPSNYNNIEIRYKKNLLSLKREIDSTENVYTRVFAYGRDNLTINDISTKTRVDNGVAYNEHELGQPYIENYQYFLGQGYSIDFCRENFINDYEFDDEVFVNRDDLYNGAKEELELLSVPKITYSIDAIDLAVLSGYSYESFNEGDTIRVYDSELNTNVYATVINKKIPYDNPQRAKIVLSNYNENLGDFLYNIIKNNRKYTDINKSKGKSVSYSIASREQSIGWRNADYIVEDINKSLNVIINDIVNDIHNNSNIQGAEIIVLDGRYELDGNIILDDNISLTGIKNSTEFYPNVNNGLTGITVSGTDTVKKENIQISNIKMTYGGEISDRRVFTNSITVSDSKEIHVHSMVIDSTYNNGMIFQDCENIDVFNNLFTDVNDPTDVASTTSSADAQYYSYRDYLDFKNCVNADIYLNTIQGVGGVRIINIADNSSVSGNLSGNYNIYNNYIKTYVGTFASGSINRFYGIYINSVTDGETNVNIYNNIIYVPTSTLAETIYINNVNISITSNFIECVSGAMRIDADKTVTIDNNIINITKYDFITINTDGAKIQNNNFSNDTLGGFQNGDLRGIVVRNEYGSNANIISNNNFTRVNPASGFTFEPIDINSGTVNTLGGNAS